MKYDLAGAAELFFGRFIETGAKAALVKAAAEAVRYPAAPMQALLAAVTQACLEQPGATPMTVLMTGVLYGLAVGILCEKERGARRGHDITAACSALVNHHLDEGERAELIRECGEAVRAPHPQVRLLLARVAEDCASQPRCSPVNAVQTAVLYGIPLGVLCGQERALREGVAQ